LRGNPGQAALVPTSLTTLAQFATSELMNSANSSRLDGVTSMPCSYRRLCVSGMAGDFDEVVVQLAEDQLRHRWMHQQEIGSCADEGGGGEILVGRAGEQGIRFETRTPPSRMRNHLPSNGQNPVFTQSEQIAILDAGDENSIRFHMV